MLYKIDRHYLEPKVVAAGDTVLADDIETPEK